MTVTYIEPAVDIDSRHGLVTIRPWVDPVIDAVGFDPRSEYVERYWLSVLGPSTTWLLRRLADGFEIAPDGFDCTLRDLGGAIGLGTTTGRRLAQSFERAGSYGMARGGPDGAVEVRRKLPALPMRLVARLPAPLRAAHRTWQEEQRRIG